ncbi:MAG TPA: D-2-hydroxyacid dehydrogenase [Burkholderiales bacterium]|nr:D-2-hydroxyacid dehydrogenase [Burkholderiales bacterium]
MPGEVLHLHLESFRKRPAIFHLTEERWRSAAGRHRALAKRLRVTIGWDGDIIGEALKTADAMINSSPPRENLRSRAPRLKWIQTTGAGIDSLLPLDWLPRDIALTNNRWAHGPKAEDSCALAITMLNARLPQLLASQRHHTWEPVYTTPVAGKTAVVIGFGDLGQAAGRAAKKLGARVIAVTRSGKAARPADSVCPVRRIDRVLHQADFVIITTPLTPETRNLLDRRRLDLLKPEAGLVNIGRAPVVDYDALREKLADGTLAGAVLDVFQPEPLPADSPLWDTPNLVLMPHVSCDDPRYVDRLLDFWFENFERLLDGKPLKNRIDSRRGY